MASSVQVLGLQQALRSARAAGVELKEFKAPMRKASVALGDRVRAETPKKSGRMASTVREGTAARRASVKIGRNPTKFAYVNVLQYGKKSRHKGFIDKAVKKATKPVIQIMEDGVKQVLRRNNLL
jgi:hypothetical protein